MILKQIVMCNIQTKLRKEEYPKYIYKVVIPIDGKYIGYFSGVECSSDLSNRRVYSKHNCKYFTKYLSIDGRLYNKYMHKYSLISGFVKLKDAKVACLNLSVKVDKVIIRIKIDKRSVCYKGDATGMFGTNYFLAITKGIIIKSIIPGSIHPEEVKIIATSIVKPTQITEVKWKAK